MPPTMPPSGEAGAEESPPFALLAAQLEDVEAKKEPGQALERDISKGMQRPDVAELPQKAHEEEDAQVRQPEAE